MGSQPARETCQPACWGPAGGPLAALEEPLIDHEVPPAKPSSPRPTSLSYDRGIRSRWKLGGHPRRCWNICFLSRALLSSCAVHLIQREVLHIKFSPRSQAFVSDHLWHPAGAVSDASRCVWHAWPRPGPVHFALGRVSVTCARGTHDAVRETARPPERSPPGRDCAAVGTVTQHRLVQIHGASGGEDSGLREKPPKLQAIKSLRLSAFRGALAGAPVILWERG